MIRRTLILVLLCLAGWTAQAQKIDTTYARKSQLVTLDLHWTADNYGNIQWQKSADGGQTWTDVSNQTGSTYTFNIVQSTLLRALITGDPACPPIEVKRQINVVNISCTIESTYADSAVMHVSGLNLPDSLVAEYGFCEAFTALSRNYALMPRVKLGEQLPGNEFDLTCTGLRPNQKYNVRFYIKLTDGTIIYGPGKLVSTLSGAEWTSENWTITKTSIKPYFEFPGASSVKNISLQFGTSENTLQTIDVTSLGDNKYCGALVGSLTPATTYFLKVSAIVDDDEVVITKQVKTLTDYSSYAIDNTEKPISHRIDWGNRTLTKISIDDDNYQVEYPRMVRAANGTLILTYHGSTSGSTDHWRVCYLRKSYDDGANWTAHATIYTPPTTELLGSKYYRFCNPQVTLLDNGWLIMSITANGNPETNENCKVLTCISKDNGETWSDPVIVGRGRTWEPHVVQLPGGELELLVSSEAAWWGETSNLYQEIVFARSTDYGQTWTAYERACYLPSCRDGMPVPVLLQGNQGVLFSIESINSGLAPSLVHRDLNGEWDPADWDRVDDDDRWLTNLNAGAGAPYTIQIPTGELVVLAHTNQAGSVWQTNRPQVVMASNTGKTFKYKTLPAITGRPLNSDEGAYYNSLFLKDSETIWLLVTRATYDGETREKSSIEFMEGKIVSIGN